MRRFARERSKPFPWRKISSRSPCWCRRALRSPATSQTRVLLTFQQIGDSPLHTTLRLQAANMAIACAGYRIVSKVGHHRVSLESTKLVSGKAAHKRADYFEACRRSEILSTALSPMLRPTQKQKRSSSKQNSFALKSKTRQPDATLRSCPPRRLNSAGQQRNVRDEQQTQDFHLQEITQLARSVGAGVLFRSPHGKSWI